VTRGAWFVDARIAACVVDVERRRVKCVKFIQLRGALNFSANSRGNKKSVAFATAMPPTYARLFVTDVLTMCYERVRISSESHGVFCDSNRKPYARDY